MGCADDQSYVRRKEGRQVWEKRGKREAGDGSKGEMVRERRERRGKVNNPGRIKREGHSDRR